MSRARNFPRSFRSFEFRREGSGSAFRVYCPNGRLASRQFFDRMSEAKNWIILNENAPGFRDGIDGEGKARAAVSVQESYRQAPTFKSENAAPMPRAREFVAPAANKGQEAIDAARSRIASVEAAPPAAPVISRLNVDKLNENLAKAGRPTVGAKGSKVCGKCGLAYEGVRCKPCKSLYDAARKAAKANASEVR